MTEEKETFEMQVDELFELAISEKIEQIVHNKFQSFIQKVKDFETYIEANEMIVNQICEDVQGLKTNSPTLFESEPMGFQFGIKKVEVQKPNSIGKRGKAYDYDAMRRLKSEGYTQVKIAELLNCSISTVKRALKSGK